MRCARSALLFGALLAGSACGGPEGADRPELDDLAQLASGATPGSGNCVQILASCTIGGAFWKCCTSATTCTYELDDGSVFPDAASASAYCLGIPPGGSSSASNNTSSSNNSTSSGGQCYGVVPSCAGRGSSGSCREDPGCYWTTEMCYGVPDGCGSFGSSSTCYSQRGCYWDSSYNECVGGASSCESSSSRGSCTSQYGCAWREAECSGSVANTCDRQTSESSCNGIRGCSWGT